MLWLVISSVKVRTCFPPPSEVTFDSHKSECTSSRGVPRRLLRGEKGKRCCLPWMQGLQVWSVGFESTGPRLRSSIAESPNFKRVSLLTWPRHSCQSVRDSFFGATPANRVLTFALPVGTLGV